MVKNQAPLGFFFRLNPLMPLDFDYIELSEKEKDDFYKYINNLEEVDESNKYTFTIGPSGELKWVWRSNRISMFRRNKEIEIAIGDNKLIQVKQMIL